MIGPSTDSCGKPYSTVDGDELVAERRTCCLRPRKYESNQSMTVSSRPYETRRRRRSVSWSTLSNAADRSSRIRTARLPESSDDRISDTTFNTAVSVEWLALYADCRSGSKLLSFKKPISCLQTSRSSNFETTDRFEIGRYDLTSAGSRSAFSRAA